MTTSTATTMAERLFVYSTRVSKPTCPPQTASGSTTTPCFPCRTCAGTAAEALADRTVVLIGGFTSGRYVNRNLPNVDTETEGGGATPTYEFYPSRGPATVMNFMITTSGANSYPHTYLIPSGNLLVQANISTSEFPSVCESGP